MKTLISDHDYELHLGGTAKPSRLAAGSVGPVDFADLAACLVAACPAATAVRAERPSRSKTVQS